MSGSRSAPHPSSPRRSPHAKMNHTVTLSSPRRAHLLATASSQLCLPSLALGVLSDLQISGCFCAAPDAFQRRGSCLAAVLCRWVGVGVRQPTQSADSHAGQPAGLPATEPQRLGDAPHCSTEPWTSLAENRPVLETVAEIWGCEYPHSRIASQCMGPKIFSRDPRFFPATVAPQYFFLLPLSRHEEYLFSLRSPVADVAAVSFWSIIGSKMAEWTVGLFRNGRCGLTE